ncbi:hypothetical protein, partial [Actinokineospora spheciospongiae]|uniref:hypothetical protein n=1 Tax=Actinokineospora spheciospongiae TaxID=909613 RepID=UPI001F3419B8
HMIAVGAPAKHIHPAGHPHENPAHPQKPGHTHHIPDFECPGAHRAPGHSNAKTYAVFRIM